MPEPITLGTVPPFERNLSQVLSTDKSFTVTARNLDGVTPTNVTGWAVSFVLHAYGDPNVVYLTLTVGSGVTISNGPAGEITIAVTSSNISSLSPDCYQWRLERTDSGSDFVIGRGLYSILAR